MENFINVKDIVSSVVFSFFGLFLFGVAFYIFDKLTPGDLGTEILEKQNVSAGIVVAALIIGISIIVGLAIH
jgi:putative membrane protein